MRAERQARTIAQQIFTCHAKELSNWESMKHSKRIEWQYLPSRKIYLANVWRNRFKVEETRLQSRKIIRMLLQWLRGEMMWAWTRVSVVKMVRSGHKTRVLKSGNGKIEEGKSQDWVLHVGWLSRWWFHQLGRRLQEKEEFWWKKWWFQWIRNMYQAHTQY